jgi:translation initiation factor 2 alpha subunit (eIF-2alpha)
MAIHSQAMNCLTITPSAEIAMKPCLTRAPRPEHTATLAISMTIMVIEQPMYRMAITALNGTIAARQLSGAAITALQTMAALQTRIAGL